MTAGQEDVKTLAKGTGNKLRFGEFEVDLSNKDLRKNGRQIRLERKPFQVMELLLRIRGRFVSRDELKRALWPDLHVNFERSLNTAVNSLRKALGDSPQNPRYVETRQGLGYRLVAPVEELTPAGKNLGTSENCAKARFFLNKQTQADLHRASAYLQAALHEDDRCVRAHADMAETYCLTARMNMSTAQEAGVRARELAVKAVDLDPYSAEAHAALGQVRHYFDWDWTGAFEEFERAVGLDTNCAAAHRAYGAFLSCRGSSRRAVEALRTAQTLEPVSAAISAETAWALYVARDFDAAHEQCWKILALEPTFCAAQHVLGLVNEQMMMYDEAIIEFQNAQASGDEQPAFIAAAGHAWAKAGMTAKAKETLRTLRGLARKRYVSPYWNAIVCTGLDQCEAAIGWLQKASEERDVWLTWMGVDPRLDELRTSAEFQALARRLDLDVAR